MPPLAEKLKARKSKRNPSQRRYRSERGYMAGARNAIGVVWKTVAENPDWTASDIAVFLDGLHDAVKDQFTLPHSERPMPFIETAVETALGNNQSASTEK